MMFAIHSTVDVPSMSGVAEVTASTSFIFAAMKYTISVSFCLSATCLSSTVLDVVPLSIFSDSVAPACSVCYACSVRAGTLSFESAFGFALLHAVRDSVMVKAATIDISFFICIPKAHPIILPC